MRTIIVYTDGSGTRQHSPACIGVHVILDGTPVVECSEYVCDGTNNVAELRAIRRGLFLADIIASQLWLDVDRGVSLDVDVVVRSDSEYAIGVITTWDHPRANVKIIEAIRAQLRDLDANHGGSLRVRWQYVPGHSGEHGNEVADWLAHSARHRRLGKKITRRRPAPKTDEQERRTA